VLSLVLSLGIRQRRRFDVPTLAGVDVESRIRELVDLTGSSSNS
jgi:hypothetical protein